MDDLRAILRHVSPFGDAELEQVVERFHPREVPRRTLLVRPGEVCSSFHVVRSGCLRTFFLDRDGTEMTRLVLPPFHMGTALASFLSREPSVECLEALEDSEILSIPHADFRGLLEENAAWGRFYQRILEMAYLFQNRRIEALTTLTAEERHRRFLDEHRDLALRLPGRVVASYLDIAPETLSRLRARLRS